VLVEPVAEFVSLKHHALMGDAPFDHRLEFAQIQRLDLKIVGPLPHCFRRQLDVRMVGKDDDAHFRVAFAGHGQQTHALVRKRTIGAADVKPRYKDVKQPAVKPVESLLPVIDPLHGV